MNKQEFNVLVATPNLGLADILSKKLNNLDYQVIYASDGIEALYKAEKFNAHVVVVDDGISKISSNELVLLIKKIPSLKQAYLFMLYNSDSSLELNGNINEYIKKPVDENYLIAQIKSLSISSDLYQESSINTSRFSGPLTVNRNTYMVYYKGNQFILPRKEFELIHLLASKSEKVFTRQEIFKEIWHKEITPKAGRTIDVHIRKLRSKISEDIITTVKGIGYKVVI
jgi:two-component system alkaline phosphatase synthesis response regulator PhoP